MGADPLSYYTARQLASKAAATGYAVLPAQHIDMVRLIEAGYLRKIVADLPDDLVLCAITDEGRAALGYPSNWFVHEGKYGGNPQNFHICRLGDELHVNLMYPPHESDDNPENRVRYVCFNQEAVRASDGIRIHYDYSRDGCVIEQPDEQPVGTETPNSYDSRTIWTETAFVQSWACDTQDDYDRANAEHQEIVRRKNQNSVMKGE